MNITQKNDVLRKMIPLVPNPHRFMMTRAVSMMPEKELIDLWTKVKFFNHFTEDNDPHGEHDFLKVESNGKAFFLKIDYYDNNFQFHQEDGNRVLTLMYDNEY